MSGNCFGKMFKLLTFGESHGVGVGCVVDGCPAGIELSEDMIWRELKRRKGGGEASTARIEADTPCILSGVFNGVTLGTPIAILVRNTNAKSGDYENIKNIYRPGHADFCFDAKYGLRDYRGGGRSSGRETVGRVAGGAVAKAFLCGYGIEIRAWVGEIAGIKAPMPLQGSFNLEEAENNPFFVPCKETAALVAQKIDALKKAGDSAGGIVECRVSGLPAGIGEPVFDKLSALLARGIFSIGAVKGFEIGSGFAVKDMCGSQNNDMPPFGTPPENGFTNNCGGILGGISTGHILNFRAAFKPVPSISKKQQTKDANGNLCEIEIKGRHDVCICPRAVSVVEAMAALVITDLLLQNRCSRRVMRSV
ncbi:MAG: chorismate synthase [Termitinemataceae bacterium]|nr:MAG: chorismate synthase [Termitinemataceae bacterium]